MTGPDDATVTATATVSAAPPVPAVVATTVEYGEPSPQPELTWLWRRAYVFAVTAALCVHVAWLSHGLQGHAVERIIRNDQFLIAGYALLYLAGASTEAIAKVVAAVRTSRRETTTTAPAAAVQAAPGVTEDKPPWER